MYSSSASSESLIGHLLQRNVVTFLLDCFPPASRACAFCSSRLARHLGLSVPQQHGNQRCTLQQLESLDKNAACIGQPQVQLQPQLQQVQGDQQTVSPAAAGHGLLQQLPSLLHHRQQQLLLPHQWHSSAAFHNHYSFCWAALPHRHSRALSSSSSCLQDNSQHAQGRILHGVHPSTEPLVDEDLLQRILELNIKNGSNHSSSSAEYHSGDEDDGLDHAVLKQGRLNTDTPSGGLRLRYRRKIPMFQVIEFYATGAAMEVYRERSPQELGLHPRDVTLFAPLSRLAAPQRATLVVHDGKILVKTEVVKAIITADKAVLIKGRRQKDTQKLAQQILQANDQRLMELRIHRHQLEQAKDHSDLTGLGSCERAASAADLYQRASSKTRTSARVTYGGRPGNPAGGYVQQHGGFHGPSRSVQQASSVGVFSVGTTKARTGLRVGPLGDDGKLQPAAVAAGAEAVSRAAGGELKDVPFEMLVLEILLDATAEYFYTKVQHLNWMLESIAADIRQPRQPQGAMDKAHQLIPIQKFLTRVKNDVRETCEAIQSALEDDETLQELCLTWHQQQKQHAQWMPVELQRHRAESLGNSWAPVELQNSHHANNTNSKQEAADTAAAGPGQQVRMLTEMLESYEREIQSLEGSINEAEEDLENTRSIWHMQLDSSRNHIIMVNLWLSMLNISVMATTILPAFFGMNLSSGLSDADPFYFYMVCGCSLVLSALSYPLSRLWYNHNWRKMNENELFEQKMLRVLLVQNIEDIDEIVKALQHCRHSRMDRKAFKQLVVETLGSRAMPPSQIDFLYQCFDRNRDGFLEEAELIRPLNTYHNSTGGPDSGSSGHSQSEYGQQQQQQRSDFVPTQLGSLDGLGMQQGYPKQDDNDDDYGGRGGGQRGSGGLFRHAVRVSPRQQQQQDKKKKTKQDEQSWEDDERLNWE